MTYEFDWGVLIDYRHFLLRGLVLTIELSAVCLVLSFIIGSIIGTARYFTEGFLNWIFTAYTEFFRNIPPIVQFFFWYFAVGLGSFSGATVGLSMFTSAYIGEIMRSGFQSIPKTQFDAARSSGLPFFQMIRHVIFPQALMRILPPLSVEFINVVKNSSIAMTISVMELTFQTQEIEARTFRGFEAATAVTVLYVGLAFVIVSIMHALERAVRLDVRGG